MNLQAQLAWEKECIERGTQRYYANQDRLREQGCTDQTDVFSFLLRQRLQEVEERLKVIVEQKVGNGAAYNRLLKSAALDDYLKVAYIGTKVAFQVLMTQKENTVLKVCLGIASRLEADLKCAIFEMKYPAYYNVVMNSLQEQNVSDYSHRHKVMMKKFNDFGIEWKDWTAVEKTHVGSRVLRCILEVFHDVLFINKVWSFGKSTAVLDTTPAFDDWAAEFEKERGFMFPAYLPCKIPPRDWEDHKTGGYYTPTMSARLPLVKTKGKDHRQYVESHDPVQHRLAINKMQRTAWRINEEVLLVQSLIYERGLGIGMPSNEAIKPPAFPKHLEEVAKENLTEAMKEEIADWKALAKRAYGKEQERKGQVLAFMQTHKLAKELVTWPEMYFVYNCDFRGRIYCATAGLSPQGADTAKGLLQFKQGVRLGKTGIAWLAIHGANCFGVDKVSYKERIEWTKAHNEYIQATVDDPIRMRDFWGEADKPYQFLAFCYEWAKCSLGKDENALSYIPIGLDGSCNGLQHFSAMLKDETGAKATNLMPCDRPEDIYQEVANVCMAKLRNQNDTVAEKWLSVGVTRKGAKRPVMTLPYGATQQSARQYILEYVQEIWPQFKLDEKYQWEYAKYLTPILWESIGEVVVAARKGMDWLRKNAKSGYMHWLTPIGFPVYQYYKSVEAIDVKTMLNGRLELKVRDADSNGVPHIYQQKNGIAPNFVHSIDSTHMVMTINGTDLPAYAMIHDDFGTHAGNTDQLYKAIRVAFHNLYSGDSPLVQWAKQQGIDEKTIPRNGSYSINNILTAAYFFG